VGAANEVYAHYLDRIEQAVEAGAKDLPGVLREMRGDFEAVHSGAERKPRVGVVGEIFVRSNVFSNENLIEKLEEQGLECWLAPMDEWIFYVGCMSRRRARWGGDIPQWLYLHLKDRWQKSVAHKYEACMHGFLETGAEISVEEVLKKAEPYIDDTFEGEAVLSVGKAIDMCEKGCVGVVNAHPFGCMPGTISAALLREIGKRFGAPMVSVPYDGTQSPTTRLTLEAFAEQAKALKQAVERLAASAS
jgi:predicted nucleotide-binding protein (sugar kinase/HSP70/actin superfamily)